MDVSTESRLGAVSFIQSKIDELDARQERVKVTFDTASTEIREQRYIYVNLLREACPHQYTKTVDGWNYHNNVDDSYNECKTCGKHL